MLGVEEIELAKFRDGLADDQAEGGTEGGHRLDAVLLDRDGPGGVVDRGRGAKAGTEGLCEPLFEAGAAGDDDLVEFVGVAGTVGLDGAEDLHQQLPADYAPVGGLAGADIEGDGATEGHPAVAEDADLGGVGPDVDKRIRSSLKGWTPRVRPMRLALGRSPIRSMWTPAAWASCLYQAMASR